MRIASFQSTEGFWISRQRAETAGIIRICAIPGMLDALDYPDRR